MAEKPTPDKMIVPATWEEFREVQLLWWVNRLLHLFGWVICMDVDQNGEIHKVFPARCGFRGFSEKDEAEGYKKLTAHLKEEMDRLPAECEF